jgi:hypothetical protein
MLPWKFTFKNKYTMASLEMNIKHRLTKNEALTRIKKLLSETKKQHADSISDLVENWNGDVGTFSFSAMGFGVSGTLTVKDTEIVLDGKIPFTASLFKGKIKTTIQNEADKLLS